MKVAYTAAIGDTDPIRTPLYVDPAWRYVAFTDDRSYTSHVWDVHYVDSPADQLGKARLARRIKVLAHRWFDDVDLSLWADAAFELTASPDMAVGRFMGDADLLAFRHPHRDTAMAEARAIAEQRFDDPNLVIRQVQRYLDEGFVGQSAITTTCYMLRRHTAKVASFNEAWWSQIENGSWRDQLSVDYCAWLHGLAVAYIDGHYRANPYARWHKYHPAWMKSVVP